MSDHLSEVVSELKRSCTSAGTRGIGRVFITGVSPVVMSDLTSGYNVAEDIYLLPQL